MSGNGIEIFLHINTIPFILEMSSPVVDKVDLQIFSALGYFLFH